MRCLITVLAVLIFAEPVFAEDIVRKSKVIPGEEYVLDVFYKGQQAVAVQKTTSDGKEMIEGALPEGKIRFVNETTGAYGEEYYKKGKKNGTCREYYPTGELMKESYYMAGNLMTEKEYYVTGQLRVDMDLSRACDTCGGNHEKGRGKLYYRNGALKYEWNFNTDQARGCQKAYTAQGELRFEAYYDRDGNRIP